MIKGLDSQMGLINKNKTVGVKLSNTVTITGPKIRILVYPWTYARTEPKKTMKLVFSRSTGRGPSSSPLSYIELWPDESIYIVLS